MLSTLSNGEPLPLFPPFLRTRTRGSTSFIIASTMAPLRPTSATMKLAPCFQ